ncbi:AAA family ATPase [Paenibacillus elgii]|uniref:AAA family ATPase n=1 Tax=Paenibacillus elgii TaxID=189691 RepID=UPI000248C6E4|nr:AAA family ATPase [Paenibacillus elgii]
MQLRRAERKKAKLKLGLAAPSGGGKTLGALLIAYGLMKEKYPAISEDKLWEKIAIVDTENGSGELYASTVKDGVKIGSYFTIPIEPPYTPKKYIDAIKLCHSEKIEVCILDSTTHAWAGQGGLLEQQGNIAKRSGNSYTAWRDVTPLHNQFVDAMLQTDIHVISTMRSKTEYVIEKDGNGKTNVKKLGLAPVQRDGMEYEFTAFFDIDTDHQAYGSKDRTGLFDQQYFKITAETGALLMRWLESGVEIVNEEPKIAQKNHVQESVSLNSEGESEVEELTVDDIKEQIKTLLTSGKISNEDKKNKVTPTFKEILGVADFTKVEDVEILKVSLAYLQGLADEE